MEQAPQGKNGRKGVQFSGKWVNLKTMQDSVNTRDVSAVETEVQKAYVEMYPSGNRDYIPGIFRWAVSWFSGNYRDYQAIDAHYHDLEHTLQGILCMARLLRRRAANGQEPQMPQRIFELGMLAILMHDTGYLKRRGDTGGTGAKYTLIHVDRSIEFAGEFMRGQEFSRSGNSGCSKHDSMHRRQCET